MFNLKNRPMKKSIMTFAALAALLALQELDANKEGNVLMDDDTLKKIDDALKAKQTEIDKLKTEKEAAETAKAKAEQDLATANSEKSELEGRLSTAENRAKELKEFIDKIPAADTSVLGKDPVEKDDFQKAWEESPMFKEAAQRM